MVRLCYRYGPGRLPYAGRNDVGGGIAMAATGLLAITLWFGAAGLLTLVGAMNGTLGFVFGLGLVAVPVAIPTSFIVGTLLWRRLRANEDRQWYGAVFGGLTAFGSLVTGAFAPALLVGVSNLARGEMVLREAAVFIAVTLPVSVVFAVIVAGWLVVPLGAFGGWYHERAKACS
nr:hypothetical protein [Haloferax sp. Q22]